MNMKLLTINTIGMVYQNAQILRKLIEIDRSSNDISTILIQRNSVYCTLGMIRLSSSLILGYI